MGDVYQDASNWVRETVDGAADAIESFKVWLRWAAPAIISPEPTPDDVRWGFQEHVSYLGSVGVSRTKVEDAVRDSGVPPERLEADGFDLTAVA